MDPIHAFASHVAGARFEDLPQDAVAATKTFILDTLGVGLAGSRGPKAPELAIAQALAGDGLAARVWGNGARLAAPAAALCNAYQAHCSEFDCVHEKAVVHAMTAVLAAAMAVAEREGRIDGRRLILAAALGVDVAAGLGLAAKTGHRLFRPATAGAYGATAAAGKLLGLDASRLGHAFSICYGQVSGTMQAHTEGSPLLALQLGFNARNAVVAADLAAAGFEGPQNVLMGPFGYFRLIEQAGDPSHVVETLGRTWRVTELAHKPWPSGRATHGVMEACLSLRQRQTLDLSTIARVTAHVPPLTNHLVGRPFKPDMDINYARLCVRFCAARVLLSGRLGLADFAGATYRDPETVDLAQRIDVVVRDAGDPNALTPVTVDVATRDGRLLSASLDVILGNPAKRLSREAHLAKFSANAAAALRPLPPPAVGDLVAAVDTLEALADVTQLADLVAGRGEAP